MLLKTQAQCAIMVTAKSVAVSRSYSSRENLQGIGSHTYLHRDVLRSTSHIGC